MRRSRASTCRPDSARAPPAAPCRVPLPLAHAPPRSGDAEPVPRRRPPRASARQVRGGGHGGLGPGEPALPITKAAAAARRTSARRRWGMHERKPPGESGCRGDAEWRQSNRELRWREGRGGFRLEPAPPPGGRGPREPGGRSARNGAAAVAANRAAGRSTRTAHRTDCIRRASHPPCRGGIPHRLPASRRR